MRVAVFGLVVAAGLAAVCVGISPNGSVCAQPPSRVAAPVKVLSSRAAMASAGDLMAFSTPAGNGQLQVTLIDAKTRVLSVYHIDQGTGAVELKSVRNVRWDLQMEEFNGVRPLPKEIRALLEER